MIFKSMLRIGLILALGLPLSSSYAAEGPRNVDEAIQRVYPSLVRIYVVMGNSRGGRIQKRQGAGSGVIINKEGYLVTNHHVARRGFRYVCNLADQDEIDAELVGTDPLSDIAVLKLNLDQRKDPSAPVPVARWGNSDAVRVGDVVYAMGSPAAVSQSVTQGIISNTQMIMPRTMSGQFVLDGENVGSIVRWIAHDAVIFGGNSGGPLVNAQGEVIGINEIGLGSLGGAIPSNLARQVAEEIIREGHVERSWTGMLVQPRLKSDTASKGVLVSGVIEPSPSAEAGLAAGDVITHFNGAEVDCELPEELPLFNLLVMSTPVGASVPVRYLRGGEPGTCTLTTMDREYALATPKELKAWGMTARDLTRIKVLELKRESKEGVLVETVRPGGGAAEAKPPLSNNDVIISVDGLPVPHIEELKTLTRRLSEEKGPRASLLIEFERGKQHLLTVVKLGREEEQEKPPQARKPWPAAVTQVLTTDLAKALGREGEKGVRITRIIPGHAAEKAGLQSGDIIRKVDGMLIEASQPEHLEVYPSMLRQYRLGGNVELDVLRGDESLTIGMALEAPPEPGYRMPKYTDDDFEFTVREMSEGDRLEKEVEKETGGILVSEVEPGGWAALGGLASGDVLVKFNDTPIMGIDQLKALLATAKNEKPRRVHFFVQRGIYTRYKEIEPDWD